MALALDLESQSHGLWPRLWFGEAQAMAFRLRLQAAGRLSQPTLTPITLHHDCQDDDPQFFSFSFGFATSTGAEKLGFFFFTLDH